MEDQTAEELAQEEEGFEAGFNSTDVEPVKEPVKEAPEEPEEPATAETAKPLTATDLQDLRAMIEDTANKSKLSASKLAGKLGELQQRIDAAKNSAAGISPKAKERLTNDFPELAALLFDEEAEPQTTVAPVYTDARVDDLSRTFERKLLKRDHPDWEAVVRGQEFNNWKSTLPVEEAKALDDSWDADFISDKLTQFKQYQGDHGKKAEAAKLKAEDDKKKKERLALGVTPRGVPRDGRASPSDDDEEAAMMGAFKPR